MEKKNEIVVELESESSRKDFFLVRHSTFSMGG